MDPMNGPWRVVLPVKGTERAKSRLELADGVSRRLLARAMAMDALAAVLASDLVGVAVVVTSDGPTAEAARAIGAEVVPDPGRGLNAAVRHGAGRLAGPGPVAVLLADVPALRAEDVTAALEECGRYDAAFVPDAEGTGTVLLTAAEPALLRPDFGAASAQRHAATAKRLDLDRPRLRRDVDVATSLREALALGVGPRTAQALAARGCRAERRYPDRMQASVHRFDAESGAGSVLLDDGTQLPFDGTAFQDSGLRLLRVGQRLTVEVAGDGAQLRVVALQLFGI